MGKAAIIFMVIAIIATVVFGAWSVDRIVNAVEFSTNCKQYLKRAADANTIETAKEELAKAISYAETNNLTEGVVSIFLNQPKNDIGYWYKNLTEAYSELENISEDATALEKTNVLMKLRETLTDEDNDGTSITIPSGISIYPNNVSYFWWGVLSSVIALVMWMMLYVAYENDWD